MKNEVKATLVSIGDELLIGQTINTNAAWMGNELTSLGIRVEKVLTIEDKKEEILSMLSSLEGKVDMVLMTGGLGPTKDDITKYTLCEYFGTQLVRHEDVLQRIEEFFAARGREILEVNRQQADLPESCTVLRNDMGTASGMWLERGGTIFVSMPGVPYEMKHLMTERVIPEIKQRFTLPIILRKTYMTQGIGESFLAEIIRDWENRLRTSGLSLAYLPSPGLVKLRITAQGNDPEMLNGLIDAYGKELLPLIDEYYFGTDDITLEEVVGQLLREQKASLSTAESCTGGYIAHLITGVSGSSDYYQGSVVSYSNDIKINELQVDPEDLKRVGAVSKEVVEAMAMGVQKKFNTDYAIATSGVAGPTGGSDEKPVGTIWIAIAHKNGVVSRKFLFEKDRQRNIRRTALSALMMLRKVILGRLS